MVFLRLGAETGDDIGREAAVRHHAPDLGDTLQVPLPVIFPAHLLQHPGAAGLHGKMDVLADIVVRGHRFDDFVADVFRMGSGETDSQFGADGRHAHNGVRVARTFRPTGIRHHAVGANVVAAAHNGNEGTHAVLVRPDRGDIRIGLVTGKEDVDLRLVRRNRLQQPRQRPIGVRAHDQVHFPGIQ